MKKYIKLIIICSVIIISIGMYYVQNAIEIANLPQFTFKTHSGDEKEVESLIVNGDYLKDYVNEYVIINSNGTQYFSETLLRPFYGNTVEFEQLQSKYKNFMRGKDDYGSSYFENDDYLVYATVPTSWYGNTLNQLEISILDKQTNKSKTIKEFISGGKKYWYMGVLDARIIGNEIVVIMEGDIDSMEQVDVFAYSFHMDSMQLSDNEMIGSFEDNWEYDSFGFLSLIDSKVDDEKVIINRTKMDGNFEVEEDFYVERPIENELVIYDMKRKEIETVIISEDGEAVGTPIYYDGKNFHLFTINKEGFSVTLYDDKGNKVDDYLVIKNEQEGFDNKEKEVQISKDAYLVFSLDEPLVKVKDEKLFIINSSIDMMTPGFMLVIDINTRDLLFEGEVVAKQEKDKSLPEDYYLFLYDAGFAE